MDSDIIEQTEIMKIPLTQSSESKKSTIRYAWVILFKLDVNERNPFIMVKLREFVGSNFPWRAIEGELTQDFRMKAHSFSNMEGETYYIFAKVEYGKNHNRSILYL